MNNNFQLYNLVDGMEDSGDFIPLLSQEDEDSMNKENLPDSLPILPLRNTVLFPGVVIPITVGRDKSIKLVKDAYASDKTIGVIAQKDQNIEDPNFEHLNKIGTVARILKMLRMPDGNTTIIIQGKQKFELQELVQEEPYMKAKVIPVEQVFPIDKGDNFEGLVNSVKDLALEIIEKSPEIPTEANIAIKNIESPNFLLNFISSNMNAGVEEKQNILNEADFTERANRVMRYMTKELQMLDIKNDIQSKVRVDIDKQQREFFLQQQMKTIQEELGGNPVTEEINELSERAEKKKWSKETEERFNKELDKLERINPQSMEYSVQLNYIELLLDLPWNEFSKDSFELKRARKILDRDHYGLEKIKDRIIEHIAVLKLKGDMKSPILCFAGPPGVGKTSLGKSIAEAIGRKYVRISLGGLRDEAELRGHRKTYIGAMPGRIIQNLKKAEKSNPVFILDEIDKVGTGHQGDPSSALLEILDPEQNNSFYDNYVEMDYDLSNVMFIATANDLGNIQPALRDRMEIINLTGYTVEEKVEIATKHLLPKQLKDHGMKKSDVKLSKKVLEALVEGYTRESGVRALEKKVAQVVRKVATKVAMDETFDPVITADQLNDLLGPGISKEKYENNDIAGVVTGLAWTSVGGDILFIESSITPGKGKLTLTGNLGDVMKESAIIALEYLKAHAHLLGLKAELFDRYNVHIHVPEGATPKDGPSAGITMLTSLASLFTQRKVKSKLAMTGEITLRGRVLPVGGIKEKILAAKRANIKEIILCKDNEKDIQEINEKYLKGLTFHYVSSMKEVLEKALLCAGVPDAIEIK
ncbi:endopeptidase La [Salibacteraceae bacterium]|nr:endopeptidase La [Crocinitomicaceae bacterium]MDA9968093.1 endopeptidase La [Salibacteraceae bacterium]|tara:strand:- start:1590 stop:4031 length:2442 start_codon:yes stop_codon:yes gene_type:complete